MNTIMQRPYRLTFDDAVHVWLRHWNGEFQHRIAASYDVIKERKHFGSRVEAAKRLSS